jgi:hypothetical protein
MGRPSSPNNGIICQLSRAGSEISDRTSGETENSFSILLLPEMGGDNYAGMEGRLVSSPGANERRPQLSSIGGTEGQSVEAGEGEIYESHRTPDDVTLHACATQANSPSDWPSESGDGRGLMTKAHKRSGSGRLQSVCLERSLRAHVRVTNDHFRQSFVNNKVIEMESDSTLTPEGSGPTRPTEPSGTVSGGNTPTPVAPANDSGPADNTGPVSTTGPADDVSPAQEASPVTEPNPVSEPGPVKAASPAKVSKKPKGPAKTSKKLAKQAITVDTLEKCLEEVQQPVAASSSSRGQGPPPVSADATIPEDGLQGGQTLEEVMEELTDPLDQSSRMDIDDFEPDYDEDSILGNSDTEQVELQELDPGMVDSLLGPSTSTGQADTGSLENSKSASIEEPMEEGEETPEKRSWKGDRVPSNSADDEAWQQVVSKQTKKQQAKAAKDSETEGARPPLGSLLRTVGHLPSPRHR